MRCDRNQNRATIRKKGYNNKVQVRITECNKTRIPDAGMARNAGVGLFLFAVVVVVEVEVGR